ncbi:MAG: UDP-N-acetylmuramoyl-L-alanyl-D-glutamate--2,6-diaminopimelate ligase, partial [Epsilonproteobacteria bacterium]|nr:UDP-N-acetylmuramoyl-L-alanyl-D-glutamate--2,6-diaminopimelate ligase [Campylobacterota bacterium]
MKIPFPYLKYNYITDNTKEIDDETLLLQTSQNSKYIQGLECESITPYKLIEIWDLDELKVVGVTGTNGKTTVSGA